MLIGPFTQLLTMASLPLRGPITDDQLEIIPDAGIVVRNGCIVEVGSFAELRIRYAEKKLVPVERNLVAFPGMIDAHTHLCWAGSRAILK